MTPSPVSPQAALPDSASAEPAPELAEPPPRAQAVLVDDLAAPELVCLPALGRDIAKTVVSGNDTEGRCPTRRFLRPSRIGRQPGTLLYCYIRDSNFRILMVPLRGDGFEGKSEWPVLTRRKRRGAERNGFWIRAARF